MGAVAEQVGLANLLQLERLRRQPVVLLDSAIEHDALPYLCECLERIGRTDELSVVLSTPGGSITAARRIALLLRDFASSVSMLVPLRARSAGTLVCLSANELVLGRLAELTPIDANIGSAWPPMADGPDQVSAQDVRAFIQMADDWFGVVRDEDDLQVLAIVAQRVFPLSLSSLYRFDRMVKDIALELLCLQLPGSDAATARAEIVTRLTSGYGAHDYPIMYPDALALGLNVTRCPEDQDRLIRALSTNWRDNFSVGRWGSERGETVGLIMCSGCCMRKLYGRAVSPSEREADEPARDVAGRTSRGNIDWEVTYF